MKRMLSFVMVLAMLCTAVAFPAFTAEEEGISFVSTTTYQAEKPLGQLPLTMEAVIQLPDSGDNYSNGGTIFGNYTKYTTIDNLTYSIHSGGHPRIYFVGDERNSETITFTEVNILGPDWVHLTLTLDLDRQEAKCYVNGALKQTITGLDRLSKSVTVDNPSYLGGDLREDNTNYFRGRIKSVALYNDVRTAEEVQADYKAPLKGGEGLLAAYVLTEEKDLPDLSGNGYDLTCNATWIDAPTLRDYAFSMAVIGDTQYLTDRYPDALTQLYTWVIDNVKPHKIAFVAGMGDMTDRDTDEEWARVKKEVHRLDKVVPYSIVHGNHDSVAGFNQAFPLADFKGIDGSMDGTMVNTYQTLSVSGQKYLFLNLGYQYTPTDDVFAWANDVVEKRPDHQVIVTTHSYLSGTGERNEQGERIWDKLVRKHKNIVMVLCGHSGGDDIQKLLSTGDNGNVVTQFMINCQYKDITYDGVGIVAMLYFSADGKDVQVRYYSTYKDKFFKNKNQFDFEMSPAYIKLDVLFKDIDNHWGKDYIIPLAEQGIIKGKTETTFEPDANITRAEFLTLALNLAKIETTKYSSFSDVAMSAWFAATVGTANKLGLIDAHMVKDDYFYPDQNITREEMTSIIVKLYELKKGAAPAGDANKFTDYNNFSDWTKDSIGKAAGLGVITGNPDGSFNALGNATRAEAAVIFSRLQKLL